MRTINLSTKQEATVPSFSHEKDKPTQQASKPLVSLVVPAYNEAAILERNLSSLCQYMELLEGEYCWELIIVNDGSTDETGKLAETFAQTRHNVHVLHHGTNFGLGQAFKSAFNHCEGDYVVTVDADLSYAPDHIQRLLTKIRETGAKIVTASPYMKEGKVSNVPWLRRTLSVWANRFLSATSKGNLSTLTGMVRAYDGQFLRSLNLRSLGMEINPEIIYKAMMLRARIEEIPAHLNWQPQKAEGIQRQSSMKLLRQTMAVVLSGFLFRPIAFFVVPGVIAFLFSLFANAWVLIHSFEHFRALSQYNGFVIRASAAVAAAFAEAPHTFIIGGLTLMLAIQLVSLGILALQSKNYFEETFYLGTTLYQRSLEKERKML